MTTPNAMTGTTAPRILAGGFVAFVALSAANVLPPVAQASLYVIGLLALVRRPQALPLTEVLLVALATAYVVVVRNARGLELDGAFRVLRPCFEGFLAAHVLYKWCRIRSFGDTVRVLGIFIALQFVTAVLMLANPTARLDFIQSIYSDEAYQNTQFAGALLFRGYGLSRHHLYGFPLVCGLAAAFLLVLASIERSRKRRIAGGVLAVLAMLLVTVNARVGLVPVALCYVAGTVLVSNRYYGKHLLLTAALILLPAVLFGALYLGDDFETLANWLGTGVSQFGSADPSDSSTLSDLQRMFIITSNLPDLLFGLGRPCLGDEACYSDIGIVRAVQEGGLVLLVFVLALYWRMGFRLVELFNATSPLTGTRKRQVALLLAVVVQGTFIAAVVKGEAFGTSDFSRLVAMLACLGQLAVARRRAVAPPPAHQAPAVLPLPPQSST